MKNCFYISIFVFVFLVCVTGPSLARDRAIQAGHEKNCKMEEGANLNINFNNMPVQLDGIKGLMQSKIKEIEAIAKEAGMADIHMQNMNYSVNTQNHGNCNASTEQKSFVFYGNVSFVVEPADKAPDLMELLLEKGYIANLNVNAYQRCQ